jgi:uncharacterized protein
VASPAPDAEPRRPAELPLRPEPVAAAPGRGSGSSFVLEPAPAAPEATPAAELPAAPEAPAGPAASDRAPLRPNNAAPAALPADETPALLLNRAPFPATNAPLLAVVAVDDGSDPKTVPSGLTVAIPAGLPDASARAATFRAAGHEIAILPDLSGEKRAADVAVALSRALAVVGDAATILMLSDGAPGRAALRQIATRLSETGHGVIVAGDAAASASGTLHRAGLKAAPARIAPGGSDLLAAALDAATEEARKTGGAILLALPRDLAAVLETWSRATPAVGIAPASAVLLKR